MYTYKEYRLGWDSAKGNKSMYDNPFNNGTEQYWAWVDGYRDYLSTYYD